MKCPHCGGETRVRNSRLDENDEGIIVRRRECEDCKGRVTTFESTLDARKLRARWRRDAERARNRRRAAGQPLLGPNEGKKAEYAKRARLSKQAVAEAIETGVSVDLIRSRWGLDGVKYSQSNG